MKIRLHIFSCLLFLLSLSHPLYAQFSDFSFKIENERIQSNKYTFDIIAYANGSSSFWELNDYQLNIGFDSAWTNAKSINNSANVLYTSGSTQLNSMQTPVASITLANPYRIEIKSSQSNISLSSGTLITNSGTKIGTFVLQSSGTFNSHTSAKLYWIMHSQATQIYANLSGVKTAIISNQQSSSFINTHLIASKYAISNHWYKKIWNNLNAYTIDTIAPTESEDVIIGGDITNTLNGFRCNHLNILLGAYITQKNSGDSIQVKGNCYFDGNFYLNNLIINGNQNQNIQVNKNNLGGFYLQQFDHIHFKGGKNKILKSNGYLYFVFSIYITEQSTLYLSDSNMIYGCIKLYKENGSNLLNWSQSKYFPIISKQPVSRLYTAFGNYDTLNITAYRSQSAIIKKPTGQLSYNWLYDEHTQSAASNQTYIRRINSGTDVGLYRAEINDNGCVTISDPASANVKYINIIQHPIPKQTCRGVSVTLNANVTGYGNLKFQWYHNNQKIIGANAMSYFIANPQTEDAGEYYLEINDSIIYKNTDTVKVFVKIDSIYTRIPSQLQVIGASIKFHIDYSNIGQPIQWKCNGILLKDTKYIHGSNALDLIIDSLSLKDTGIYQVEIQSGCQLIKSNTAYLGLYQNPNPFYHACKGSNAKLQLNLLNQIPCSFQWYKPNKDIINNALSSQLLLPSIQQSDSGFYLLKIIIATNDTINIPARLDVDVPIVLISDANSGIYLENKSMLLKIKFGSSNFINYQWYKDSIAIHSTNNIYGENSNELFIPTMHLSDAGTYYAIASNSCGNVRTNDNMQIVYSYNGENGISCQGTSKSITLSIASGTKVFNINYLWFKNNNAIASANSNVYNISNFTASDTGTYFARIIMGSLVFFTENIRLFNTNIQKIQSNIIQSAHISPGQSYLFKAKIIQSGDAIYSWYNNGQKIIDDSIRSGSNTSELFIRKINYASTGNYFLSVSNVCGQTITSDTVALIIDSLTIKPKIVCEGSQIHLISNQICNQNLAYTWYKNNISLPNQNTGDFVINTAHLADSGWYKVQVNLGKNYFTYDSIWVYVASLHPIKEQVHSQFINNSERLDLLASSYAPQTNSFAWLKNGLIIPNNARINGNNLNHLIIYAIDNSDAGDYQFIVRNGCGVDTSASFAINVISSLPKSTVVCPNSFITFNANINSGNKNLIYQWYKNNSLIAGANQMTYSINQANSIDTGTYQVIITCDSQMFISPNWSLQFNQMNVSGININQSYNVGQNALLNCNVTSNDLVSYKWYKGFTLLSDNLHISGTSGNQLLIKPINISDSGNYHVEISGKCNNYISPNIALNVISTQPTSKTVCVGNVIDLQYSIESPNTVLYQWYKNGGLISGANSSVLHLSSAIPSDSGKYYCKASISNNIFISDTSIINVRSSIATIINQPISQILNIGQKAAFKVTTSGASEISYQWQRNGINLSNSSKYSNVNSSELIISNLTANDTGFYSVIMNDKCSSITSEKALLGVVTLSQSSVKVCKNSSVTVNEIILTPLNVIYQFKWKQNGILKSNLINNQFTITSFQDSNIGYYTPIVQFGNFSAALDSFRLDSFTNNFAILSQPKNYFGFLGRNALLACKVQSNAPLTYQWKQNGNNIQNTNHYSGVNTNELFIFNIQLSDTLAYTLQINDGCRTYNSDPVYLILSDDIKSSYTSLSRCPNVLTKDYLSINIYPIKTNCTYTWLQNGSIIPAKDTSVFTLLSDKSYNGFYTVKVALKSDTSVNILSSTVKVNYTFYDSVYINFLANHFVPGVDQITCDFYNGKRPYTISLLKSNTIYYTTSNYNQQSIQISSSYYPSKYTLKITDACGYEANGIVNITDPLSALFKRKISDTFATNNFCLGDSFYFTPTGFIENLSWSTIYPKVPGTDYCRGKVDTFTSSQIEIQYSSLYGWPQKRITSIGINMTPVLQNISYINTLLCKPRSNQLLSIPLYGRGTINSKIVVNNNVIYNVTDTKQGNYKFEYLLSNLKESDAGDYNFNSTGNCGTSSFTIKVSVLKEMPKYTYKCIGANTIFDVTVAKASVNISYQWYRNGVLIIGANNSQLNLNSISLNDYGAYTVLVSDGTNSIFSDTAYLIQTIINFNSQPINVIEEIDHKALFKASISGLNIPLVWTKNAIALSNTATVSGVNSSELFINPIKESDYGTYKLIVDQNICPQSTSSTASLSIVSSVPRLLYGCIGKALNININVYTVDSLVYKWYKDGVMISNNSRTNLNIANFSRNDTGTYILTIQLGNLSYTTLPIIVKEYVGSISASAPDSKIVFKNQAVLFKVGVNPSPQPVSYSWFKNDTLITNNARISGSTSSELYIPSVVASDAGRYKVQVSDACNQFIFDSILMNIVTDEPQNMYVCPGTNAIPMFVKVVGPMPLTYTWFKSGLNLIGNSPNLSLSNIQLSDSGTYNVLIISKAGSLLTQSAVLSVHSPLTINQQPISSQIVQNWNASFSVKAQGSGVQYYWYRVENNGLTSNFTSSARNQQQINFTNVPLSYNNYRFVAKMTDDCFNSRYSDTVTLFVSVNKNWSGEPDIGINPYTIYPNPFENFINVSIQANASNVFDYELLDISGKCIQQESNLTFNSESHYRIEVQTPVSGIYLLKINTHHSKQPYYFRLIHP